MIRFSKSLDLLADVRVINLSKTLLEASDWIDCSSEEEDIFYYKTSMPDGFRRKKGALEVEEIPERSLSVLREKKKSELRSACEEAILINFQSSALGSTHSYDCREIDQTNLQRMVTVGNGGSIWAHDGTEFLEKAHTHEEALQVLLDMQAHEQYCRFTKLKPKLAQVNAITEDTPENRDSLEAIIW